jgi:hypothetical protein
MRSLSRRRVSLDAMLDMVADGWKRGGPARQSRRSSRRAMDGSDISAREHLRAGQVIPAHPLALNAARVLDERHQRASRGTTSRPARAACAVGVHTTQFAIRDSAVGLYRPCSSWRCRRRARRSPTRHRPFVMVAGICGTHAAGAHGSGDRRRHRLRRRPPQPRRWRTENERQMLEHCRIIAEAIPLFGFYLQPAVGGRVLSHAFWREFAEIPNVWAIKIAPFNRYQTLDVVRAVIESGRDDIALYTGNDDNIVADLVTPFTVSRGRRRKTRWIDGGLLGQWAVWTRAAVRLLDAAKAARATAKRRSRSPEPWRRTHPTPTVPCSTPRHAFAGLHFPAFTKSYVVRGYSRARGAWTHTRR